MIDYPIHPGLLLIFGAALIPFLKEQVKKVYLLALLGVAFCICALLPQGVYGCFSILGYNLTFLRVDKLSLLFSYVFTLAGLIGFIYALHVKDDLQHIAALIYMGSALGVVFAGDFLVLFVFWEIMAFASVCLVWANRTEESIKAGFRYLLVHIFGGILLLAGIMLQISETGSIAFNSLMNLKGGLSFYLIMFGFMLNAAVPPIHAWLPDAYPRATVTGAVFMSAYTTKSAVYVLIRGFSGEELLMILGSIMAVYGVIYATMENNGRRLLAYHIVSQVGFMVCGIGIGNETAINGASAHAFAHIIYKGLLFMGAGAVLYMAGTIKLTELGGLYKKMPLTMIFFVIGGLSIAGVPLMSGFVSKSMTITGAGESHNAFAFLMLTLASSGTFLSIVLKMTYYMFFGKESNLDVTEPPKNMLVAMAIASAICIVIGCYPQILYVHLPYPVNYHPYTIQHVLSALGLFAFTILGFVMLFKKMAPKDVINLDTDWFYRKGAGVVMNVINKKIAPFEYNFIGEVYEWLIQKPVLKVAGFIGVFDRRVFDRLSDSLAETVTSLSEVLRVIQTGKAHDYAFGVVIGLCVAVVIIILL
ncbi:MAG: Na(+)/H(+) antiporter subunit D [Thermodesulfovibrionales bacterium]|nr:Na(+)/H(+) antiporter subunit D [Thermodesulfovibrionales bacterium]